MTPPYAAAARRHLCKVDPTLKPVITRVGPFAPRIIRNRFATLAWSIISQQISIHAASTIRGRLQALVSPKRINAATILSLSERQLQRVGLSFAKTRYIRDLARRVSKGEVNLRTIHNADDEAVIERLIVVKGIGRWTAEMFLMFCLGRPDVLPVDDLGLRAAIRELDGLNELPSKADVTQRGESWRPYRSVGTWYLWQHLKLERAAQRNGRA